eukprot:7236767-Prymnesium_polylepis.1
MVQQARGTATGRRHGRVPWVPPCDSPYDPMRPHPCHLPCGRRPQGPQGMRHPPVGRLLRRRAPCAAELSNRHVASHGESKVKAQVWNCTREEVHGPNFGRSVALILAGPWP